jgi:hypothetical protein
MNKWTIAGETSNEGYANSRMNLCGRRPAVDIAPQHLTAHFVTEFGGTVAVASAAGSA